MNEPRWLPAEAAIAFNKAAVEITGEAHLLRDVGLLEGALARPRNVWGYQGVEEIAVLGAVLLHGVAMAHAFEQGNKRTAFACCVAFVEQNGYQFTAPDGPICADHVLNVVAKTASQDDSAAWLRTWMQKRPAWQYLLPGVPGGRLRP